MLEGLKDFYYSLEEKWYGFLDKIEEKVHIYGVIDKIDQVIPSFILLILILLLILLFAGIALIGIPLLPGEDIAFKVEVKNQNNDPQNNASVTIEFEGFFETFTTNVFGETEAITIPAGTLIDISVEKSGYETRNITGFEVLTTPYEIILTQLGEDAGTQWTVRLIGADGTLLYGERFDISFACNNPLAIPPRGIIRTTPTITVLEPADCDGLSVSINSANFLPIISAPINSEGQEIILTEKETDYPDDTILKVIVQDDTTFELLDDITVEVAVEGFADASYFGDTFDGEISFNVLPQTYIVRVFDTSSDYRSEQQTITAAFEEITELQFFLIQRTGDNPVDDDPVDGGEDDTISVQVLEKGTGIPVLNASVTLFRENTEISSIETNEDNNALITFVVDELDAVYRVTVDHDEYFLEEAGNLEPETGITIIELRPFVSIQGGTFKIQVFDLDSKPVKGALVQLANEEEYLLGYSSAITDFNGLAQFDRVVDGTYKAFASKGYGKGWSNAFNFEVKRYEFPPVFPLSLKVGNGTIRISVTDADKTPLKFTELTIFDIIGDKEIGTVIVEDENGFYDFVSRADKTIYVKASRNGYAEKTTEAIEIIPEEIQNLPIELERETISGDVRVRFLGLFLGEKKAQTLTADTKYTARFEMVIPKDATYREAGINVRFGNAELVENDIVFIKEINAPNASIKKYSKYSENYENDILSLTNFESKWASIVWANPSNGVYELEAVIKTKDIASLGDNIPVHFRAWAKNSSNQILRDPKDNAVENELYALSFTENFAIGAGTICSSEFCFDAQILDVSENLIRGVSQDFEARLFKNYRLDFTLINNEVSFVHQNAELRIDNANKGIAFSSYVITTAQGNELRKNFPVPTSDLERINVGNFAPGNRVKGSLFFSTKKTADNVISFLLVSNQRIRFDKDIVVRVEETKELSSTVVPSSITALTPNTLTITIKDKETSLEVKNVQVKIVDRFGDTISSPRNADTNKTGMVKLSIEAMDPLTELTMIAEKGGYLIHERTLTISEKFIDVKPESIGFILNPLTQKQDIDSIEVDNPLDFDIVIDSFEVEGNLKNLIDKEKMNNFLSAHENSLIKAGKARDFDVRAFLTNNAENLKSPQNVSGTLVLNVSNSFNTWILKVPLTFNINLGGGVDLSGCFNVSQSSWNEISEGAPIKFDIEIENNCSVEGTLVDLKDISAMIEWQGNEIGEFTLSIQDEAFIQLREAYFRKFLGSLSKDSSKIATLEFTPNGGVKGEAKAKILLRASNLTESGDEFLEDSLNVNINVQNILDCVAFNSNVIEMDRVSNNSFTVETLDCGQNVKFVFDSDLIITPKVLTLSSKQKSPEIIVEGQGENPGQYLINAKIETQSNKVKQKAKNLIVRIHPLPTDCLHLNRYEFDIFDDPNSQFDGFDSGELLNNCVEKPVDTKIDQKSLTRAMRDALPWSLAAFGLSAITNPEGIKAPFGFLKGDEKKDEAKNPESPTGKATLNTIQPVAAFDPISIAVAVGVQLLTGSLGGRNSNGDGGSGGGFSSLLSTITGGNNPWVTGIGTFIVGTLVNYFGQDDIELTVIQPDLILKPPFGDIKLVIDETPLVEKPDSRIGLALKETEEEILQTKLIEKTPLVFKNVAGIVQTNPDTPFFSNLKIEGEHQNYKDKKYEDELPKNSAGDVALEKETGTKLSEKFHLQFNAFNPSERVESTIETASCQIGAKTGTTGEIALPKVEFDWSWSSNSSTRCDAPNGLYCDATQFSIELVDKLDAINDWFIDNNGYSDVLKCPTGISCPAYSTANLDAFYVLTDSDNSRIPESDREKISKLLHFNSFLIQDGYSVDFMKDFENYYSNIAFVTTPDHFLDPDTGIKLYFETNPSRMAFDYIRNSVNAPIPGPGEYRVDIIIDFDKDSANNSWRMFKGVGAVGDRRKATITVKLTRLSSPENGSAFYYLPIDGLIGRENERVGYGADFSGTQVKVNDKTTSTSVSTLSIPGSVPVIDVTSSSFSDFKSLNTVSSLQGNTLKLERRGDELFLVYSPSYAKPIQLQVNHSTAVDDVFAFYSVEVNGGAQNTGPFLAKWNGIGVNCKDFNDRVLPQTFSNTPDIHGLNSNLVCARLGGDQLTAYGLEWCNPVNAGKVLVDTVIYTPTDVSSALIKMFAKSDSSSGFRTIGGNTVSQLSLNTGEKVTSIEKIFELVRNKKMCVTSSDNSTLFWWNPKPLLDGVNGELLAEKEKFINDQCIQVN